MSSVSSVHTFFPAANTCDLLHENSLGMPTFIKRWLVSVVLQVVDLIVLTAGSLACSDYFPLLPNHVNHFIFTFPVSCRVLKLYRVHY